MNISLKSERSHTLLTYHVLHFTDFAPLISHVANRWTKSLFLLFIPLLRRNILLILSLTYNIKRCAEQQSASPLGRYLATKKKLFLQQQTCYFYCFNIIEKERWEKELISTYDNCRTFARCLTRGRIIPIRQDLPDNKNLH